MSANQNRTTKTANTGKATTAEKAAGKKAPEIRSEIQSRITALKRANTSLANAVYKAAMTARELAATEAENAALLREIPKQRRADYRRIVGAPADHVEGMPSNLVKGARYLQLRADGLDGDTAHAVIDGKAENPNKATKGRQSRPEERNGVTGATPAAEGGADTGGEPGAVAAPKPSNTAPGADTGALALIQQGVERLEADYPNDATIGAACRALRSGLQKAADHVAKLEANKSAKKGGKKAA